jgi:flagellar basal body-associated protein FliL
MGPLGMAEIIMIIVVLIMIAITIGIILALVWYFSSRSKPPQLIQAPQVPKSIPERLSEIDGLRSQNLISEAEHEEKRRHILGEI